LQVREIRNLRFNANLVHCLLVIRA
jgi:hypothetical protein